MPAEASIIETAQRKGYSVQRFVGRHSSVTLINGDCEEMLPIKSDAVVTDPPYGIGEHGGACRTRGKPGYSKHADKGWDDETPSKEIFDAILESSETVVIWGGNYFADKLPPTMGWLYWRKLMGGDFSDGELAWTSKRMALREYTKCPKGMDKAHPCEKPVALMAWAMERCKVPEGATVLDPYMGVGTTGVACLRTGRNFIGIERDAEYYKTACDRIAHELDGALL